MKNINEGTTKKKNLGSVNPPHAVAWIKTYREAPWPIWFAVKSTGNYRKMTIYSSGWFYPFTASLFWNCQIYKRWCRIGVPKNCDKIRENFQNLKKFQGTQKKFLKFFVYGNCQTRQTYKFIFLYFEGLGFPEKWFYLII